MNLSDLVSAGARNAAHTAVDAAHTGQQRYALSTNILGQASLYNDVGVGQVALIGNLQNGVTIQALDIDRLTACTARCCSSFVIAFH